MELPKHNVISQRGKSILNKTGVINLKPKEELLDEHHPDNLSAGDFLYQPTQKKTFKMPPVLKGLGPQVG